MTEQEILNGNKLILDFMEYELETTCMYNDDEDEIPKPHYRYNNFLQTTVQHYKIPTSDFLEVLETTKFHKSYDWLMPVVEKIETLTFGNTTQFDVVISKKGCCITQYFYGGEHQKWQTGLYNSLNKIESVWKCCVDFIIWFNKVDKTNLNETNKLDN